MIDDLISRVFALRNAAHLGHWAATGTGSYARHMALGDLYDGLIDRIDGIVEAYQGRFGLVKVKLTRSDYGSDPVPYVRECFTWINANRAAISRNDAMIDNMLLGLQEFLAQQYYKLTNLQ